MVMTQSGPDLREDMTAMLAAAGITVTDEGKARARARLAESKERWTPERRAELRAQLGMPPAANAA
jgi:predicted ATPase